jgi:ComF family protein
MQVASPLRLLRRIGGAAVAFALPPRCPGCGVIVATDHSFCLSCWQALDFLGGPACAVCAEPLVLARHDETRCAACLAAPPPFDRLRAAVAYGPIARALALKLKYARRPGLAVTMAGPMRRAAATALAADALVVPVPLHRRRLWARGYNQAALLARAVARRSEAEPALDLLVRRRATVSLRGLGPRARERTVSGAFAVRPGAAERLRGRPVVLVDDVYTTGATVRACARALRRAGAGPITVLCWARVVRDGEPGR